MLCQPFLVFFSSNIPKLILCMSPHILPNGHCWSVEIEYSHPLLAGFLKKLEGEAHDTFWGLPRFRRDGEIIHFLRWRQLALLQIYQLSKRNILHSLLTYAEVAENTWISWPSFRNQTHVEKSALKTATSPRRVPMPSTRKSTTMATTGRMEASTVPTRFAALLMPVSEYSAKLVPNSELPPIFCF